MKENIERTKILALRSKDVWREHKKEGEKDKGIRDEDFKKQAAWPGTEWRKLNSIHLRLCQNELKVYV